MLKAVLVDDEELALEQLAYVLSAQKDVTISGTYTDPIQAVVYIKCTRPEIVFIDVSMPCMNGFQLAKEISDESYRPYVVFITAYREYAINAFEVEAVDYVQKPIYGNRLDETLNRIRRKEGRRRKTCDNNAKSTDNLNWFPVEENGAITLLSIEDVYYCSVEEKTTKVHTKNKVFDVSCTLSKIEENYSSRPFFRCHKSFIVNLNHVEKIIPLFNQNHSIKLRDMKIEIPVSRHYIKSLKSILKLDHNR